MFKDVASTSFWLVILAARIIMILLGFLVVPVALYGIKIPDNPAEWRLIRLPAWALPWDNIKDGVLGDKRFHYWKEGDQFPALIEDSPYLKALYWLAVRNPANYFSRFLRGIGCPVDQCTVILLAGVELVRPSVGAYGWQFVKADGPVFNYWGFYWATPHWTVRLGHKIEPRHNGKDFSADPLKAWKGVTFKVNYEK